MLYLHIFWDPTIQSFQDTGYLNINGIITLRGIKNKLMSQLKTIFKGVKFSTIPALRHYLHQKLVQLYAQEHPAQDTALKYARKF